MCRIFTALTNNVTLAGSNISFANITANNLYVAAIIVSREKQFFDFLVLCLTVAKVDSIGFVVRKCIQCSAGKL